MFPGCALHAGEIWKGDILIADSEELEILGASEIDARRVNVKEVMNTPYSGSQMESRFFSKDFCIRHERPIAMRTKEA